MQERYLIRILKDICEEKNIKCEILSYDLIIKLKKDNKIRYIVDNCFGFNQSASDRIVCDKYALYEVLKSENIPIIEHRMLFNPNSRGNLMTRDQIDNAIEEYINKYDKVVIKANDGFEGKFVYLSDNYNNSIDIANKLFNTKSSISICPFYDIKDEYRVVYLNGKCLTIYSKQRPFVIGNGINNVKELMNLQKDNLSKYMTENKVLGVDLDYVPKENENALLNWKHNLYNGAKPVLVTDKDIIEKLNNLAKKVAKTIGISFATIDIIETKDEKLNVLEINSGVCMDIFSKMVQDGYKIAKEIYSNAIDEMFK